MRVIVSAAKQSTSWTKIWLFFFWIATSLTLHAMTIFPSMAKEYTDKPIIQVRILDKVTARARTFDLSVGQTVTYGNLRIKPRSCQKSSPLDEPESAAFLQIWEVGTQGERTWIFSGWMFASSPSLSAMEHPVYDVWVIDCLDPENEDSASESETFEAPSENESAVEDVQAE